MAFQEYFRLVLQDNRVNKFVKNGKIKWFCLNDVHYVPIEEPNQDFNFVYK